MILYRKRHQLLSPSRKMGVSIREASFFKNHFPLRKNNFIGQNKVAHTGPASNAIISARMCFGATVEKVAGIVADCENAFFLPPISQCVWENAPSGFGFRALEQQVLQKSGAMPLLPGDSICRPNLVPKQYAWTTGARLSGKMTTICKAVLQHAGIQHWSNFKNVSAKELEAKNAAKIAYNKVIRKIGQVS